jgi:hypothetical protein
MLPKRKRSGGPQTEEGKKATSRNALKTGAYSNLIILPGESEEDFRALEEQFIHDFSPRDIAEAAMVRNLAVITWKKIRVEKLEHAGLIRQLHKPFELPEYFNMRYDFEEHAREKVLELARVTETDHLPQWKLGFQLFNKFIKQGATVKELDQLQNDAPIVYEVLLNINKPLKIHEKSHADWLKSKVTNPLDEEFELITYLSTEFLKKYSAQEWVVDHFDFLKTIVADIQEKRLLKFIQFNSAQRVYDDLDRSFYKTLSELRRHQQWRRDMQAIDVTPTEDDE